MFHLALYPRSPQGIIPYRMAQSGIVWRKSPEESQAVRIYFSVTEQDKRHIDWVNQEELNVFIGNYNGMLAIG